MFCCAYICVLLTHGLCWCVDLLIDSELLGESSPSGTKAETPNVKKKHRRARSGINKNLDASQDGGE